MKEPEGSENRGYTDESLRMLETVEGQLNAIFACFGSAAQHAQLFEQSLARFLVVYNRIVPDTVNIEDIESKMTIGQLLRKLRERVKIENNSIEELFSTSLDERNFLIHRFFLERTPEFETPEGRMGLLSELVGIEGNLDGCRVVINSMRIAICRTLGVDDPWALDYPP